MYVSPVLDGGSFLRIGRFLELSTWIKGVWESESRTRGGVGRSAVAPLKNFFGTPQKHRAQIAIRQLVHNFYALVRSQTCRIVIDDTR